MKLFFLLAGMLLSNAVFAQPVINAGNYNALAGDATDEYDLDTVGYSPGPGGAGVTWNFAPFNGPALFGLSVHNASGTPFSSLFPGANISIQNAFTDFHYYDMNATGQYFYGWGPGYGGSEIYTDPAQLIAYPFTYLSAYVDTFYAQFMRGTESITYDGTVSVEGDGYGTITTPTGTYTNVLRVKIYWDFTETRIEAPDTSYFFNDNVEYHWIKPGLHFPVFTYKKISITSDSIMFKGGAIGRYIDSKQIPDFVNDVESENNVSVYPNPCSTGKIQLFMNRFATAKAEIQIMNANGQLVYCAQSTLNSNVIDLDVQGLERGLYFIQVSNGTNLVTQKFVINKE